MSGRRSGPEPRQCPVGMLGGRVRGSGRRWAVHFRGGRDGNRLLWGYVVFPVCDKRPGGGRECRKRQWEPALTPVLAPLLNCAHVGQDTAGSNFAPFRGQVLPRARELIF